MRKPKRVIIKEEFLEITGDTIEAIILNYLFEETQKEENKNGLTISLTRLAQSMMCTFALATINNKINSLVNKEFLIMIDNHKKRPYKRISYKTNNEIIDREMMRRGYRLFGYK